MSSRYGFRCPDDVAIALEKHLEETEQELTEFFVSLLRKELGIAKNSTVLERLETVEQKVQNIEARLDAD